MASNRQEENVKILGCYEFRGIVITDSNSVFGERKERFGGGIPSRSLMCRTTLCATSQTILPPSRTTQAGRRDHLRIRKTKNTFGKNKIKMTDESPETLIEKQQIEMRKEACSEQSSPLYFC